MARMGFRLNREAFSVLCVVLLMMINSGNAFEFRVGGGNWSVPKDPNAAVYIHWAEKHRFQIGDSILFIYGAHHDSVLLVTKENYANCNTGSPIEKFTDGHTSYKFNRSGAYYFISGVSDNCHKDEKMVVIVMADRSNHNSSTSPPSPAPEVSPPSLAPSGQEAPSPPPSGEESNPKSPPKNSASGIATGSLGAAIVALFGVSLVLI